MAAATNSGILEGLFMTMTFDTSSPVAAEPVSQSPRLRIGLIVLAALYFVGSLSNFPAIFIDYEHTDRLLVFAQRVSSVKLALAPFITAAALFFAIRYKLTHAIVALATLMLVTWLAELPSIAIHGMELKGGGNVFITLIIAAQRLLYPLLAVAAMALALRNQRLVTAAMLTAIPMIEQWLGVAIFAIGVSIYGF